MSLMNLPLEQNSNTNLVHPWWRDTSRKGTQICGQDWWGHSLSVSISHILPQLFRFGPWTGHRSPLVHLLPDSVSWRKKCWWRFLQRLLPLHTHPPFPCSESPDESFGGRHTLDEGDATRALSLSHHWRPPHSVLVLWLMVPRSKAIDVTVGR